MPSVEELVRSGYAAFNSGQAESFAEFWHSDAEYINAREDPDPGIHRGLEDVRTQFARWVEVYPDLHADPPEIHTNGDRAFVWVRVSGRGSGSGVPISVELANVWTVEKGKIRRIEEFFDRAEGLEAAGLGSAS